MKVLCKSGEKVLLESTCPFCGTKTMLVVTSRQFREYFMENKLVQEVFPEYDYCWHEMLVTEVCPTCQETMFC